MVRIARKIDPRKITLLKKQISDPRYMTAAIQRLAQKMTEELVERNGGNLLL